MSKKLTPAQVVELMKERLTGRFNINPDDATDEQLYKAAALILRDIMQADATDFYSAAAKKDKKQVCYLCMEFLMGRSMKNTLFNMGLENSFAKAFKQLGSKIENIYELEPDAGLGNGGLGRLAACFLDGLASQGIPAYGYSIMYEYGIFRQKLVDGWQTEMPDFWLPGGKVWLVANPDEAVEVKFDGYINESWDGPYHQVTHENYTPVIAVPHDLMVEGYNGKGVSVLRLWSAKAPGFDMKLFNEGDYLRAIEQNAMAEVISKVLYPSDNHIEGKSLRLKQQYFLVCASIADIVKKHLKQNGDMRSLPEHFAIHINDTHPAMVIPELMRVLLDECGFTWDDAWDIVTRTVAYTNHTVMREALECWTVDLFQQRLPRIYQIIKEIDNRSRRQIWERTQDVDYVERTAIVSGGIIRMANLSVIGGHCVNGVSQLHSDILKQTVFNDYYNLTPNKFTNVTNGIAHRRWLCQSNPGLTKLLDETIGTGYKSNAAKLADFNKYRDDSQVLERLEKIKLQNKKRLAAYVKKAQGITIDPNTVFDVQAKRLHEYKRQHLNAMHILADYLAIKANPNGEFLPKTYLFAAKAAPGYYLAKEIIKMITNIANMIDKDPDVKGRLKVVYLEDYRVSLAELLMPSAEISEQISLAGTEASGTGNMKLMINGAVTLGTEDGANVEIHKAVGDDNIIIFGMTADEVAEARHDYNPYDVFCNNAIARDVLQMLKNPHSGVEAQAVAASIINSDPYMVLKDFDSYCAAQRKAEELYKDRKVWNNMSLTNIAQAGIFASDRAIRDYAKNIWKVK
ncbi:MAG: glycogen/starch/alpha-glucan phosphorylase [Clostridia bacterium]|nr:glycogen/starch/alpha-glucan phosphorylase [Clostridia bacterium]